MFVFNSRKAAISVSVGLFCFGSNALAIEGFTPPPPPAYEFIDGDGVQDAADNCPLDSNPDQLDTDGDGVGNICDPDRDGDNVLNETDAFPDNANESTDFDKDGYGDNADTDDDNDEMPDAWEIKYGFDSQNPNDAEMDTDGDGKKNLDEYLTGSNPKVKDNTAPDPSVVIPIIMDLLLKGN